MTTAVINKFSKPKDEPKDKTETLVVLVLGLIGVGCFWFLDAFIVWAIYGMFAPRYHWPTLSYWDTFWALLAIGTIGSRFGRTPKK